MREREQLSEIIFISLGFTFSFGAHSISKEVVGFSPLWFPRGKSLCLLSLVIIVVHVILLDKILISYCLNDKNLTFSTKGSCKEDKENDIPKEIRTYGVKENKINGPI